jgi:hypothetical protein
MNSCPDIKVPKKCCEVSKDKSSLILYVNSEPRFSPFPLQITNKPHRTKFNDFFVDYDESTGKGLLLFGVDCGDVNGRFRPGKNIDRHDKILGLYFLFQVIPEGDIRNDDGRI